jgi:two-component system, NarL family, invasion response regulator UvrY
MNILVIDDHPVVRQGIRQILESEEGWRVTAEAPGILEALPFLRGGKFDVLVLDINLPGSNGLEALADVQREAPELPVLIFSIHSEEHLAMRALKNGARGFLNKEHAPEELVRAVRRLAAGGSYVSPRLAEWLALEVSGRRQSLPHESLSDREYQVMCLIASGKTVSQIAEVLHRSPNTISTYRARIFAKMGARNNAELTLYAINNRLIASPPGGSFGPSC